MYDYWETAEGSWSPRTCWEFWDFHVPRMSLRCRWDWQSFPPLRKLYTTTLHLIEIQILMSIVSVGIISWTNGNAIQEHLSLAIFVSLWRINNTYLPFSTISQVSFEDVEHLKKSATLQRTRIPHFMRDQGRYLEQLHHITAVNGLTDEELLKLIPQ